MAFDGSGNLFAVNNFDVTVYAPGGTRPIRTITAGITLPSSLAIGHRGDVYVANWGVNIFRSTIAGYLAGSKIPRRTVTRGLGYPLSLTFDDAGDLYAANLALNTVTEYAEGTLRLKRTFAKAMSAPSELAFGP
ncbi:MAG: hypothetical protein JOY69_10555 [Candidatus Eremiobacteraeota bacterium]|nr:hypothetical protein [Candidatus Eremiobacteraeota bacterium]